MPNEDLMPNEIPSLWPADLLDVQITTPVSILRKQANDLATATRAVLRGEVVTETSSDRFTHSLYVVAPALDYRYLLCYLSHGITLYPCKGYFRSVSQEISSEADLITWLQKVIRDPSTHKVLASLIAQSKT
jgi:hypothetical protein